MLARPTLFLFAIAASATPHCAGAQQPRLPDQFEPPVAHSPSKPPIQFSASYSSDLNADVSGGARRGVAYLGKIAVLADADLDRLLGVPSATAHVSVIDVHGTGLSSHFIDNLASVSGIEAEPAIRLNQAWVEFGLKGDTRLRLGKFPASQDFMASDTAGLFVNATFGWPASFATNLPSGGPSWPLAAPGVMIKAPLSTRATLAGAIFAGDPAGPGNGDPQRRDKHGFNTFGLTGRPFVIAEAAERLGSAGQLKMGGWVHFDRFDRLAPPLAAVGGAASGNRNWAVYGVADWRLLGNPAALRQLHAFVRATASPKDRNPVSIYIDLGVEVTAPFARRPKDSAGVAFAHIGLSSDIPSRDSHRAEQVVEFTYRAAVTPSFSVQPNLQLVISGTDPALIAQGEIEQKRTAVIAGLRMSYSL